MTNKVYVLSSSAGMGDEFRWWIEGIFTDPIVAEEKSRFITSKSKAIKDAQPSYDDDDWFEYYNKYSSDLDFNECKITEYELNKLVNYDTR